MHQYEENENLTDDELKLSNEQLRERTVLLEMDFAPNHCIEDLELLLGMRPEDCIQPPAVRVYELSAAQLREQITKEANRRLKDLSDRNDVLNLMSNMREEEELLLEDDYDERRRVYDLSNEQLVEKIAQDVERRVNELRVPK